MTKKISDVPLKDTLEFQLRLEDQGWGSGPHITIVSITEEQKLTSTPPRYWRANPGFVTKNFNQQIPLSMHILDTKTLKTNWDPHYYKYYIQ